MRVHPREGSKAPVSKRSDQSLERNPWKLLLWTVLAGLVFGLIGLGELPEDYFRMARNHLHSHKATGDIVLVEINDSSLHTLGALPWPRSSYARMVDSLTQAGAKRIFIDIILDGASNARDDSAFARALA